MLLEPQTHVPCTLDMAILSARVSASCMDMMSLFYIHDKWSDSESMDGATHC